MQVSGEVLIFKNDFGFSTSISNKKLDGTYDNMIISVQFRKDDIEAQRLANKTKINIKNGFLSFYKGTNGLPKVKVIVLDFEPIYDVASSSDKQDDPIDDLDITINNEDDLPF